MSIHGILLFLCVAWLLTTDTDLIAAYWQFRARLERNLRAVARRDRTDRHFKARAARRRDEQDNL